MNFCSHVIFPTLRAFVSSLSRMLIGYTFLPKNVATRRTSFFLCFLLSLSRIPRSKRAFDRRLSVFAVNFRVVQLILSAETWSPVEELHMSLTKVELQFLREIGLKVENEWKQKKEITLHVLLEKLLAWNATRSVTRVQKKEKKNRGRGQQDFTPLTTLAL